MATASCTKARANLVDTIIQKHPSWIKLRRLTAEVLRYKDNLLAKMRHHEPAETDRNLTVRARAQGSREDLHQRSTTSSIYDQEVKDLQTHTKIKRSSRICRLDPVLSGILVCRVRSKGIQTGDDRQGLRYYTYKNITFQLSWHDTVTRDQDTQAESTQSPNSD